MLSFIVPAYNEELELPATLASIHKAATEAGFEYEIVLADDASTDATPQIAKDNGARVVSINRRHIAAARNAGGRAAQGDILFFVDADTQISAGHITGALRLLEAGCSGGGARVAVGGEIPRWSRYAIKAFCIVYFANNLGAGAFLFTTRSNFEAAGGFDERYFIGEEIYFSQALKKLGRFKILREPVITSGRKLRMHSAGRILSDTFGIILRGPRGARSRKKLALWYDGKRETGTT